MARSRIHLPIGHRSGFLTVIGSAVRSGEYQRYMWLCKCDCGAEKRIATAHLLSKKIKSCGCATGPKTTNVERGRKAVITRYRQAASARGFVWGLTNEGAIGLLEAPCYYCGSLPASVHKILERAHVAGRCYIYNGIDRVDSSQGYVPGNVVTACAQCNYAKGNLNQMDFLAWVQRIAAWQKG